jgi:hypothetical protein
VTRRTSNNEHPTPNIEGRTGAPVGSIQRMQKRRSLILWSLAGLGTLLTVYIVSCYIFILYHIVGGRTEKSTFTTVYLYLGDTQANRRLMSFYSPLRSLPIFDMEVYWAKQP